jgi:Formate/nitrite transporter
MRGILANALVCLAVWLTSGGRSLTDKIFAILFPISALVPSGFEHSIANMYFLPLGIPLKDQAGVVKAAALPPSELALLGVGAPPPASFRLPSATSWAVRSWPVWCIGSCTSGPRGPTGNPNS